MSNAIFVSENMASTKLSSLLKTARYQVAGLNTAINNGCVVVLGAKDPNQREVYIAGATAAATDPVYIVDTPELIYSQETTSGLNDYTNAAGQLLRTRKPMVGDHFAISARAITPLGAAPVVGNSLVTPAAGILWAEILAPVGTESVQCLIEESYVLGADLIGGRNITMYSVVVTAVID
jgi:hypothetical protein